MYRDIPEELRALIEPIVEFAGFELVDVQLARGGKPLLLRVTIDTPLGDGRVSIDACASVARELSTQFDVEEPVEASYQLEVSSPGLDRTLARQKDFTAACGSEVQIETRAPVDGRRRFRGMLVGFENEVATVDVDGQEVGISFEDVAKAKTVYKFTPEDFAGRAG